MYEPLFKLKIKAQAGIDSARQELSEKLESRVALPLIGINGEVLYISLTEGIMSKVKNIQTIYEKVSSKNKARDMIILDAYHSATIEGARTTVDNVKRVFAEPKSKDDKMVVNTVKACDFAYQTAISGQNIRVLWDMIVEDVCENESKAGALYRDGMVFIGSESEIIHVPAATDQIPDMMERLFTFLNDSSLDDLIKAFVMHFYFVYVHPFCDGNGRTVRVMAASYLYHHGYEKIMYLPLSRTVNENLSGYYGSLKDSEWRYDGDNGYLDITPFISYMLDMFEKCIVTSILEEHELSEEQKTLLVKMKKQGSGAEITVKNAMKILKLSKVEVLDVLESLKETGHLSKVTKEGTDIYIL